MNGKVGIVRRAFRWGVEDERVPSSVWDALRSVQGLKQGRSGVREALKVGPALEGHIAQALPHMPPFVAIMVQLQLWTAMRPGEVIQMRAKDIDMSGDVWLYKPRYHKNTWRGHSRTIPLGPQAQSLIRPLLRPGFQDAYLFSPRESERMRREAQRERRETPLWPSHVRAQEAKRAQDAERSPGDRYMTTSYSRAVRRACEAAGVKSWTPRQLRHNAATEIRRQFSVESAMAHCGHR